LLFHPTLKTKVEIKHFPSDLVDMIPIAFIFLAQKRLSNYGYQAQKYLDIIFQTTQSTKHHEYCF